MASRLSPSLEARAVDGYRTRIVIPPDRTVIVQLPPDLPDGPATLIIRFEPPGTPADSPLTEAGHDPGPPDATGAPGHDPPALRGLDMDWFD